MIHNIYLIYNLHMSKTTLIIAISLFLVLASAHQSQQQEMKPVYEPFPDASEQLEN